MHAHKKESVDTIKKYIVKVQHQEKNKIHKKPAEDSPKTSVESSQQVQEVETSNNTSLTPKVNHISRHKAEKRSNPRASQTRVAQMYCRSSFHMRAFNYETGKYEMALVCEHCSVDGCKLEWENKYENDGTPDNSFWTSIETDGILETSPSVDNENEAFSSNEDESSNDTSMIPDVARKLPKVQAYC